jgi:anti-anti-sigma factor
MDLIEHVHADVVVLEPRERLTVENEAELRQVVSRHLDEGRDRLILDLEHVPYIDSCGLGTIAHTHLSARQRGGWLRLRHVKGRNRQLLTVTRLLDVIGVDQADVLAASA